MVSFGKLTQETFDAHNQLRANPQSFIPDLEGLLKLFKGQVMHKPGEIPLMTNEGPGAIKECIQFLRAAKSLPLFQWVDEMARAAQDHADDIGPKNIAGHSGSDGSSMTSRLEKYGDWESCVGENIDFGGKTGREVVCNLIVDDGNAGRGHRKNIFNQNYVVCGVGSQKHGSYKTCIVIDYAGGFTKKGQQPKYQQDVGFPQSNMGFPPQGNFGFPEKNTFPSYSQGVPSYSQGVPSYSQGVPQYSQTNYSNPTNVGGAGYNPKEFSDVKSFFADKFKDVPEANSVFSDPSNPAKYTYTYKTTGQNPVSNTLASNNYDDKFKNDYQAKNFDFDNLGKANKLDFGSYGFAAQNKPSQSSTDQDKPDDVVQTRVTRNITVTNGKKCIVEKKIYTLKDGSTKTVENQTFEN